MPVLNGNIDDTGKLTLYQREKLEQWIRQRPGRQIVLSIELRRKRRSNPQNAYYWGVVVPMVKDAINDFGNEFDTEETHEFLKARFNSVEVEMKDGYYFDVPRSTTGLTTVDFMAYLDRIKLFGADILGIYIPDPNEQTEFSFNNQ